MTWLEIKFCYLNSHRTTVSLVFNFNFLGEVCSASYRSNHFSFFIHFEMQWILYNFSLDLNDIFLIFLHFIKGFLYSFVKFALVPWEQKYFKEFLNCCHCILFNFVSTSICYLSREKFKYSWSTQPASFLRRQREGKSCKQKKFHWERKENSDKGIIFFDGINHHEPLSFPLFASTPHKNI